MSGTYTNGGPMQNNFGIPSTKLKAIQGLNNPYSATTTGFPDMGNAAQAVNPMNGGTPSQKAGGIIGLGSSLVTAFGQMLPKVYDTRVGMQRPNFARSMSDATYTGMGAAVGGPWGALVGGIIDTGKNIGSYFNEKGKYNTAVNRFQNDNAMQQRLDTMAPDYTGAAKYGMKVGEIPKYQMGGNVPAYQSGGQAVPVELEDNEAIIMPQPDGSYQWLGKTSANAPSHEQGGVNMNLPEGALVFPGKYVKELKEAHAAGDWSSIKAMEGRMMQESNEAARQGKPFSTANGNLFGDGGMVRMAEKVKTYDPIADVERKSAQSIFAEIQSDAELSDDDRDMLIMGLTARIKQDAPAVKTLKEQYPDHYNYFTGGSNALAATPKEVPDVIKSEFVSDEQVAAKQASYSADVIGYGAKKGNDYLAGDFIGAQKIGNFDPNKYYSYLDAGKSKPGMPYSGPPMQSAESGATPTIPGIPTPVATASIGTGDRTATRHAAMKAGVYLGADGTPLTYWDDKAGKRMFTTAAKALDPSYVGAFNAAGTYKAQPKVASSTTTPKTTTATPPKGASGSASGSGWDKSSSPKQDTAKYDTIPNKGMFVYNPQTGQGGYQQQGQLPFSMRSPAGFEQNSNGFDEAEEVRSGNKPNPSHGAKSQGSYQMPSSSFVVQQDTMPTMPQTKRDTLPLVSEVDSTGFNYTGNMVRYDSSGKTYPASDTFGTKGAPKKEVQKQSGIVPSILNQEFPRMNFLDPTTGDGRGFGGSIEEAQKRLRMEGAINQVLGKYGNVPSKIPNNEVAMLYKMAADLGYTDNELKYYIKQSLQDAGFSATQASQIGGK